MKLPIDKDEHLALLEQKVKWFERKYGPYIAKRGTGNWKNLFRKPTMYEWVILFMVVMSLFISWAYQVDTAACRETLKNIDVVCLEYTGGQIGQSHNDYFLNISDISNFSTNFSLTADVTPDD